MGNMEWICVRLLQATKDEILLNPNRKMFHLSIYQLKQRVFFFFSQRLIYFSQHLTTGHCRVLALLEEAWRCQEPRLGLVFASPAALAFSKFTRIY